MLQHNVEAYKATDEGRGWVEEEKRQTVEQRETLWSWDSLSVTLYSSYNATTQTNTDTHTHTHSALHCAYHPDPLSPHFETLKMRLSKGSLPDSLPGALGGYRGQAHLS